MEAKQLIEKILADANAEAESIKKEADDKIAAGQKQTDRQLSDYKKETKRQAAKRSDDKKSHILAAARMRIAKDYLAEKREIIDEVFQQAEAQIKGLCDEDYLALMSQLMSVAVETGDEEVIVDTHEARIDEGFINGINSRLKPPLKQKLRLSEIKQELGGGFILKRDKIKTNVSIKVLLEQARNELEIDLARQLFEE